jgi:YHS domain-containing protein
MKAKRKHLATMLLVAAVLLVGMSVLKGCKKSEPKEAGTTKQEHEHEAMVHVESETAKVASAVEQKTCPVMGGASNKNVFTEYKGKKVYFCCAACKPKFKADPEKYIAKLPQFKN